MPTFADCEVSSTNVHGFCRILDQKASETRLITRKRKSADVSWFVACCVCAFQHDAVRISIRTYVPECANRLEEDPCWQPCAFPKAEQQACSENHLLYRLGSEQWESIHFTGRQVRNFKLVTVMKITELMSYKITTKYNSLVECSKMLIVTKIQGK